MLNYLKAYRHRPQTGAKKCKLNFCANSDAPFIRRKPDFERSAQSTIWLWQRRLAATCATNQKEEIAKMRYITTFLLFLMIALTSFYGCGGGGSDAPNSNEKPDTKSENDLQPPDWKVGDSWTVETEIFDQVSAMPGSASSWTPKQAWRFEVEDIKAASKSQQYILCIEPVNDNRCPYKFRFWLRSPDLFICSYEISGRDTPDGSSATLTPYRKYTDGDGTTSYFFDYLKNRFPTFPISLLPIFDDGADNTARSRSNLTVTAGKIRQQITIVSGAPPSDLLDRALISRSASGPADRYAKVTLECDDVKETQYWKNGLPWAFYGHRRGGGAVEKRFRLVDYQLQ
jgi:hypothetical protein